MNLDIPSEFVEFPWLYSQYSVQELAHFWGRTFAPRKQITGIFFHGGVLSN